jgi:hypothetical protein
MDNKPDYQKEEVMGVMDFGGIPEGSPKELNEGTDMTFILDPRAAVNKVDEDPMWSSSSAMPSDWLFAEE